VKDDPHTAQSLGAEKTRCALWMESDRKESVRMLNSTNPEYDRMESDRMESGRMSNSANLESDRKESDIMKSDTVESDKMKSDRKELGEI
jgi:hypothetical protein